MKRVAVCGASGFVGAALVERLLDNGVYEVHPLIHSSGSAWRLARRGLQLRSMDVFNIRDMVSALDGCTHVVNCIRGGEDVMLAGLANLLKACRSAGVQRFVHLSSVSVYGDPPPPESMHEEAVPKPVDPYGTLKLRQDEMVQAASRNGLPSVILCPPNITGPCSYFLLNIIAAMRQDKLALVEGGNSVCNIVDVQNLTKAIELALSCDAADGTRIFVTDDGQTTWRQICESVAPLAEHMVRDNVISREEAKRLVLSKRKPHPSVIRSLKHLVSSDVRAVLRRDPLLNIIDTFLRGVVGRLSGKFEARLRTTVAGPISVKKVDTRPVYDELLCKMQLREVRHSCDRAKRILDYTPEVGFSESMKEFTSWYRISHGMGSNSWTLLREL